MQADAANQAAGQSAAASRYAADLQKQMFDTQNAQLAPNRAAGYNALNQIAGLGAGGQTYDANGNPIGNVAGTGYLTHQFNAQDLQNGLAPNYDFMLQQGQMANQRAANAAGGGLSGNALQGLDQFTQDYASNAYQNAFNNYQTQRGNIFNTLASIAGLGQSAQGTTASLASNAATSMGQAAIGAGQAQAAGTVGAANAMAGGIQGAGNAYFLSNMMNKGAGQPGSDTTYSPISAMATSPVDYGAPTGMKFNATMANGE
jgi:hypothetical protein